MYPFKIQQSQKKFLSPEVLLNFEYYNEISMEQNMFEKVVLLQTYTNVNGCFGVFVFVYFSLIVNMGKTTTTCAGSKH